MHPVSYPTPDLFPPAVATCAIYIPDNESVFPDLIIPPELSRAVTSRKLHYLAGRYCSREALRSLGYELASEPLAIGHNRGPIWPSGYVGSISHTTGIACAAVAQADVVRGVGIDVEQIMGTRRFERVISMIASPAEFRRLKEGVDWSNEQLATLVFSAKESAFKCQHPIGQRYWEFEQYSVESIDSGARAFTIRMPDGPLALGRFHVADGYAFTGMVLPPASS